MAVPTVDAMGEMRAVVLVACSAAKMAGSSVDLKAVPMDVG